MIYCLLVQITRNSKGQEVREERDIAGDNLRMGRGADCILHLPDPRINLHHATIQYADDGKLYLESARELLSFNGVMRKRDALRAGMRLLIGPYQLTVEEKDKDHDLVLGFELIQALPDDRAEFKKRSRTSLAQTGLSKRSLAVGLAALITLAFLVLPVLNAIQPELRASSRRLPISLDEAWSPGAISTGHQGFAKDCQQCHTKPFVRVEDQACRACHLDLGDHLVNKTLQTNIFGNTRCASCHLEHKVGASIAQSNPALCVGCHSNLTAHKSDNTAITLANIHDFGSDHPGFKLSIKTAGAEITVQRIDQNDKSRLKENSGLKFPHDIHTATKGIKSPDGITKLQCISCHAPDEAGVRFKPVAMKTHCANCHRLEFEPAVSNRHVPHGDVAEVMTSLREFYGSQSVAESPIDVAIIDGLLQRPEPGGIAKLEHARASAWANQKANVIATDLFEVRVCVSCHEIKRNLANEKQPWTIAPVTITEHWLPKNNFSHNRHTNSKCSTCHNVSSSKSSADIAIPDILTCQSCHAGATPARNKVTSTCESCHGFHMETHLQPGTHNINAANTLSTAKTRGTP